MKLGYSVMNGLLLAGILWTVGYSQTIEGSYAVTFKGERGQAIRLFPRLTMDSSAMNIDSLQARRRFLGTLVSQRDSILSKTSIIQILSPTPRSEKLFRRGLMLRPVGPLMAVAGLAVGFIAIRGNEKTGFVRGVRTATTRNVPDIQVQYTSRSLPLLASGIGLLVGGICLIELSNGFTKKSVDLYNASVIPRRLESRVENVSFGITSAGTLGFEARF